MGRKSSSRINPRIYITVNLRVKKGFKKWRANQKSETAQRYYQLETPLTKIF